MGRLITDEMRKFFGDVYPSAVPPESEPWATDDERIEAVIQAIEEGEASGIAEGFDFDTWLAERQAEDGPDREQSPLSPP